MRNNGACLSEGEIGQGGGARKKRRGVTRRKKINPETLLTIALDATTNGGRARWCQGEISRACHGESKGEKRSPELCLPSTLEYKKRTTKESPVFPR